MLVLVSVVGCRATTPALETAQLPEETTTASAVAPPSPSWPDATRSPWPPPATSAREAALISACGGADGALTRIAQKLVGERVLGRSPDPDRVVSLLRSEGQPHLRPRLVTAGTRGPLDDEALQRRFEAVKQTTTRCGLAIARRDDGAEILIAVAVDALADLAPLPIRARTGEWLTLNAIIHAPATGARVVLLGPRGSPRTVPTAIDRRTGDVHARFALDRPGAFTVQLVADLAGGPLPVLEARIFADTSPPDPDDTGAPVPGEDAKGSDDADTLARMTNALRSSESRSPLHRNERLDALAAEHAQKMRAKGAIAHDLGDGDLAARFEAAGLSAKVVGENVARARSIVLAHRALHASPSHRMNLLNADYTNMGIFVTVDDLSNVYVCQVFSGDLR